MGTTNHGTQEITYEYFEEATAKDFNKRHFDIQPRGVYKGGYLVRVSDSEVTLSIFTAEIGDDDEQISVKTSTIATLNSSTLDSGSISSGTPFLVLRWGFLEQADNYVEVHAIASVAAAQANDIIVGKCVFIGGTLQTTFDYTDRTFLTIQDLFFKVETSSEMYVQLRAGRIQDGTQYIIVPEQKVGLFIVPGSPNSRIDLVYIDTDGTVSIKEGTQAVSPTAPDYESKLVVAEVRIVNGDLSIPADRITDVRSFLVTPVSSGQSLQAVGNTDITTKSLSYVDMTSMNVPITTKGGKVLVIFSGQIKGQSSAVDHYVKLVRDSVKLHEENYINKNYEGGHVEKHYSMHYLDDVSAGTYTYKVQWHTGGAHAPANGITQFGATYPRVLSVIELPF